MAGKRRKENQHGEAAASERSSSKRRSHPSKHQRDRHGAEADDEEQEYLEPKLSSRILEEALNQQKEILAEEETQKTGSTVTRHAFTAAAVEAAITRLGELDNDDDDDFSETQSQYDGYHEIDEEDEKVLATFMSKDAGPQRTLADLIIQRIKEKDAQVASEPRPLPQLDSSIIDLYKGVGKLLSRYTTGKLPKAFKVVPSLSLWEDVLYLTEPEKWSPNAMYQATRIFASNLSVKRAQRFYNLVLLPRVRDDILKNKRLHFALYQSLKKSLYKPAAFFKGIFLPLCQSGTCSLREAVVIGSVIQKVSIPPLHSSAALMKIAEMDYCGTTSYFIKLLLDKKYALPYRVLDAVTAHFMRFLGDERVMPVIWHQSLLTFVQRYKNELMKEDKNNLDRLIQHQKHYLVTPEIRRELKNSRSRGEKEDDAMLISSSTSVINKTIEEDRWNYPAVPMEED
ncbi:Bystin [Nymphaea thermarum]|nr:Bystin [Nymphaea thermarum]